MHYAETFVVPASVGATPSDRTAAPTARSAPPSKASVGRGPHAHVRLAPGGPRDFVARLRLSAVSRTTGPASAAPGGVHDMRDLRLSDITVVIALGHLAPRCLPRARAGGSARSIGQARRRERGVRPRAGRVARVQPGRRVHRGSVARGRLAVRASWPRGLVGRTTGPHVSNRRRPRHRPAGRGRDADDRPVDTHSSQAPELEVASTAPPWVTRRCPRAAETVR